MNWNNNPLHFAVAAIGIVLLIGLMLNNIVDLTTVSKQIDINVKLLGNEIRMNHRIFCLEQRVYMGETVEGCERYEMP